MIADKAVYELTDECQIAVRQDKSVELVTLDSDGYISSVEEITATTLGKLLVRLEFGEGSNG